MDITLFKKIPCVQCDRTAIELNKLGLAFDESPNIADDAHADLLKFVKSLGYLQAPVVYVKIDDDTRAAIPSDEIIFETITKNELAQKVLISLRDTGVGHWSGFNPDNIKAIARVRDLSLQLVGV